MTTSSEMEVALRSSRTRREDGKVVDLPAGLAVFRVGDGKLSYARKYDINVRPFTQWWTGMIPLA